MLFVFGSGVFNKDEMLLDFGFGVFCVFAVSTWMVVMCVFASVVVVGMGFDIVEMFFDRLM